MALEALVPTTTELISTEEPPAEARSVDEAATWFLEHSFGELTCIGPNGESESVDRYMAAIDFFEKVLGVPYFQNPCACRKFICASMTRDYFEPIAIDSDSHTRRVCYVDNERIKLDDVIARARLLEVD